MIQRTGSFAFKLGLTITFHLIVISSCNVEIGAGEDGQMNNVNNVVKDDTKFKQVKSTENTSPNSISMQEAESKEEDIRSQSSQYGVLHTLKAYEEWVIKEEKLTQVLAKRLDLLENEIKITRRYLQDYEESTGEALRNLREPVTIPEARAQVIGKSVVLGHRMTRRYSTVLDQLKKLLLSLEYTQNEELLYEILQLESSSKQEKKQKEVGSEDMFMSMTMFLTLQSVYHLTPDKLRKGLEYETKAGGELNPTQCAEIGIFALYRQRYAMSVEWLELANSLQMLSTEGLQKGFEISCDMISSLLWISIQDHNQRLKDHSHRETLDFETMQYLFMAPVTLRQSVQDRITYKYDEFINNKGFSNDDDDDVVNTDVQFEDLCQGNKFLTTKMEAKLRCYYENKIHPYLYVNPIKTEVLSEDPPMIQFYEMIGNETNTRIQNEYVKRVTPSQLVGSMGMEEVSFWRTSAGTGMHWLESERKMYSLAEFLTGLKIWGNSEHTQYAEYTYGRFYINHVDMLISSPEMETHIRLSGDRLVTMLYYLELPESGGLTSFCQAGFSARPVRNSAIVWYNLYRNGSARNNVEHGSCPVIHGHKIIMNHWVNYYGNWDPRHKCSLNQFE